MRFRATDKRVIEALEKLNKAMHGALTDRYLTFGGDARWTLFDSSGQKLVGPLLNAEMYYYLTGMLEGYDRSN